MVKEILRPFTNIVRDAASNGSWPRLSAALTYWDYRKYERKLSALPTYGAASTSSEVNAIVGAIRENGFYVIKEYFNKKTCEDIRGEIDGFVRDYHHLAHPYSKADIRFFGANNLSDRIKKFFADDKLLEIAQLYYREPTKCALTMAARMDYQPGNIGSGEGWHRDSAPRQFKGIVYLSDVEEGNGPFQFVKDSHKLDWVVKDTVKGRLPFRNTRQTEEQIALILEGRKERLITFPAPAGTLILADVSSLHRGMPIKAGSRYALTNYYLPAERIDQEILAKFHYITENKEATVAPGVGSSYA